MNYTDFLESKAQIGTADGFDPIFMPEYLFDFQRALTEWAVQKGRGAIFADCGLGKTPMQLVWAENVHRATNKPVLILTPLAVAAQTIREGDKFEIEVRRSSKGEVNYGINVTNYERLHYFNPSDFAGVVCDESSILKNFNGKRRQQITAFTRKMRYRLLCTATAAPNDYHELGTSSEALGYLGQVDMLNRFFKNDMNTSGQNRYRGQTMKWRFKGHAEDHFWRWVCSWARATRMPSDLGFEDGDFILPPIEQHEHMVESRTLPEGLLFALPAIGMREEREEVRRTITERCERVAELVDHTDPALVWCHLNKEGDTLKKLIPDAVQVSGSDSDEVKESKLLGFQSGKFRVLVTKPKIGAWGLNFQHCSHVTFFPSHSFEQYYQGVRRCWRFGQKNNVRMDVITTEGQADILANLQRKARAAERMFDRLVSFMNQHLTINNRVNFTEEEEVPPWL